MSKDQSGLVLGKGGEVNKAWSARVGCLTRLGKIAWTEQEAIGEGGGAFAKPRTHSPSQQLEKE